MEETAGLRVQLGGLALLALQPTTRSLACRGHCTACLHGSKKNLRHLVVYVVIMVIGIVSRGRMEPYRSRFDLVLQTDEILLRRWTTADAGWYVESRDEEVFRWTTEKRDLTIGEAAEAIRDSNRRDDLFCFGVVDSRSGQLLGNIALLLLPDTSLSGEVMFWLAPWARGRGMASKATRLLCRWAFNELKLERVVAKTLPDNLLSQRVLRRLGFQESQPPKGPSQSADQMWFVLTSLQLEEANTGGCSDDSASDHADR
jgi:RimJ/RimL family protein N-acetyltransferase